MKERPIASDKKLFILVTHVPKCCGSSVLESIVNGMGIKAEKLYRPTGGLKTIFWKHPSNFDYLIGHFPWGVQWFFRPWTNVAKRPRVYIATLRDPIDQMISFYYFQKQLGLKSSYKTEVNQTNNIVDFYRLATRAQNLQVKMYAGLPYSRFWDLALSTMGHMALIERAVTNLTLNYNFWIHHSFINASIQHLGKGLGVPLEVKKAEITVTHNRPEVVDLPETTLDELRNVNTLDIELHNALIPYMECFAGYKITENSKLK